MKNCKKCGKIIDDIDIFPKGICLACYEKEFDKKSLKDHWQKEGNPFSKENIKKITLN